MVFRLIPALALLMLLASCTPQCDDTEVDPNNGNPAFCDKPVIYLYPKEKTDIIVSLGCAINFCGGAVSFAILGLFCSELFGVDINIMTYILMLITALLINMAAPGIPNGGVVIGATYLSIFNIPLDFIGFYSGIYKMLDMSYTTLNVTGDITASILLTKGDVKNE